MQIEILQNNNDLPMTLELFKAMNSYHPSVTAHDHAITYAMRLSVDLIARMTGRFLIEKTVKQTGVMNSDREELIRNPVNEILEVLIDGESTTDYKVQMSGSHTYIIFDELQNGYYEITYKAGYTDSNLIPREYIILLMALTEFIKTNGFSEDMPMGIQRLFNHLSPGNYFSA